MLAWVDIETTGLNVERDQVLEVGLTITLDDLTLLNKVSYVVHLPFRNFPMPEVVRQMHTKNGLLDECRTGRLLAEVEQELCFVMKQTFHGGGGVETPPMCGSSVHFDRAFLKRNMPRFEAMFHYRNIDVSTVKELVNRWFKDERPPMPIQQKLHRVDPDLTDTINEARYYKDLLF